MAEEEGGGGGMEAEEEEDEEEEEGDDEYEDLPELKPMVIGPKRGKFNQARIDEMSRPNRRFLLSLYESYGAYLGPEKLARVKKMLEETYSMSPEQTEMYFKEMRMESLRRKQARDQRRRDHIKHKKLMTKAKKRKVKITVIQILKECMIEAYNTPLKILMSERLRQVSDACLGQLCDILELNVPDRDSSDNVSRLLIFFSDWLAYWIETIAYDIEANRVIEDDASSVKEVKIASP